MKRRSVLTKGRFAKINRRFAGLVYELVVFL